ncbi:glycosyltransferase family 2 protein [Geminocystis herdmanii]|uniref:glycosyltransferase family 2 protein n=1 Tax=Geminocystis herdmanii TaxID=669359 RepID=UPI00034DC1B5|nr:glycosyltransferase family 2 protein [Geminocystis herdmanii]
MTKISVIIPTYNRLERLKNCLESFTKINYDKDLFEIIIVDDGSSQSLDNIIKSFEKILNLTYLKQENTGPATARNNGATKAKGKYLVFTDDDCEPDTEWLGHFNKIWEINPDAVLGGKTINKLTNNIYSQASQCLVDYLYKYYNFDTQKAQFFTSNNFALPKHIFKDLGGFNTTFPLAAGEDRELCYRLFQQDFTMIYVEKAIIYHAHLLTFKGFWRQHFNYGQGAKYFHSIKTKNIKVEPIKFYWQLLTYPLEWDTNNNQKLSIIFLFLLSQIANTFGFFLR